MIMLLMWTVIKLDGWVFVVDRRESVRVNDVIVVGYYALGIDGGPVVEIVEIVVADRPVVLVHGREILKASHVVVACLSMVRPV